jgi:hypothetical protein
MEKLNQTKNYTIAMGDLEAKVAAYKAEVEQRDLLRRTLEYDLSVARRELAGHKASAAEWEQHQLTVQQQIEEKVHAMRKDKAAVDEQLTATTLAREQSARENADLKDAFDMKAAEFAALLRAKDSLAKLQEATAKELDGYRDHNAALKAEAALVPQLRAQLAAMDDLKGRLRDSDAAIEELTGKARRDAQLIAAASEENQKLHTIAKQLEEYGQRRRLTHRLEGWRADHPLRCACLCIVCVHCRVQERARSQPARD